VVNGSGERQRAARVLIRVGGGAFASPLLAGDRSPGVRARVLGVLRWQRTIDQALRQRATRPLHALDAEVLIALRLGLFEAWWLGVPAAVATDAMVRLVRRLGKGSAAGFINAVLRRAVSEGRPSEATPDVEWSHPEWIWRRWNRAFGRSAAVGAMAAGQAPAPPWVWFPVDADLDEHVASGVDLEAHPWCADAWTSTAQPSRLMALVAAGRAVVQDPSSQLVARLAAAVAGGAGRAVDLCAAPGGKTALIGRLGRWHRLVAAEVDPFKAARLAERLASVPVVVADARRPALVANSWDLVLLDAPCTGTGTFRRHPELKWRLRSRAVCDAADRQRPMIDAAAGLVAPGGVLVYATCSIEPEENEAHFESTPKGFERAPMEENLPTGVPWLPTTAGGVRILPHEWGDGFTVHAVRRPKRASDSGDR
jgi:16S rRNA (cytosine967-C5)-methyltransferase